MTKVIAGIKAADTGKFFNFDGAPSLSAIDTISSGPHTRRTLH
jgi:hypothetical protein